MVFDKVNLLLATIKLIDFISGLEEAELSKNVVKVKKKLQNSEFQILGSRSFSIKFMIMEKKAFIKIPKIINL